MEAFGSSHDRRRAPGRHVVAQVSASGMTVRSRPMAENCDQHQLPTVTEIIAGCGS